MAKNNNYSYNGSNLSVLKDLESVRKRPSIYIDSTDKDGLHQLCWEIIGNSINEALAGYCNEIHVVINPQGYPENSISISDNGRGMPIDIHPIQKISYVEIIMTKLYGGGNFDSYSYKVFGNLHGVGASVTNALSDYLDVKVKRDGILYKQVFSKGVKQNELEMIEEIPVTDTGTTITFHPDPDIFKDAKDECNLEFDFNLISLKLEKISNLNKGLKIILSDFKNKKYIEY